ncbi:MAG: hypothetical protein VYE68_03845 [Acidobacteriota bacterium]|nr:hypothetical protein [Acidobacteriota bacterium]
MGKRHRGGAVWMAFVSRHGAHLDEALDYGREAYLRAESCVEDVNEASV